MTQLKSTGVTLSMLRSLAAQVLGPDAVVYEHYNADMRWECGCYVTDLLKLRARCGPRRSARRELHKLLERMDSEARLKEGEACVKRRITMYDLPGLSEGESGYAAATADCSVWLRALATKEQDPAKSSLLEGLADKVDSGDHIGYFTEDT